MKPLVSFIVPAFNAERYVAVAVRSALTQTISELEVIVVDDGSQDGTAEVVRKIARDDTRVVLLCRNTPGGPAAARNLAIDRARGEWVAVLDADDLIKAERTERLLALARCTSSQLVADNFVQFEDGTERILSRLLPIGPTPFAFDVDPIELLNANAMLGSGPSLQYLKPMIATEFVNRYGLRYDERLRAGADFQLCAEALLAGARYLVLSEPLYLCRLRTDSDSRSLCIKDLDHLVAASGRLRERVDPKSSVLRTIDHYTSDLERARAFLQLVQATKGRGWSATARILTRPEFWPIITRFGYEAIAKHADSLRQRQFLEEICPDGAIHPGRQPRTSSS